MDSKLGEKNPWLIVFFFKYRITAQMERLWITHKGGMVDGDDRANGDGKINLFDYTKINKCIYQWVETFYEICWKKRDELVI